jgi:hypothetical protein
MQIKGKKEIHSKFQKFILWEVRKFGISQFFQEPIKISNK